MDNETDASSHQTATSLVDTTTPVTSPDHSQQSDSGSGCRGKKRRMSWGWDGTSTMPANSAPSATTSAAAHTPKTNSNIPNPIFSASSSHMDLDSIFPGPQSTQPNVEEGYKRSLEHFPNPGLMFPMPALEFDFRIAVTLNPELSRSETRVHKEIITVASGSWSGSFGNGRVLAGGYDLGQARGYRPIRIVEGAFVLQTSDQVPAIFEMRTRGSLSGPCNILDSLLNPQQSKEIDPRQYSFRMFSTVKAADKRYAEIVNCGLWVACGVWKDQQLVIDAYRVT